MSKATDTVVETFGWDVVYATTVKRLDDAAQASGKLPTAFDVSNKTSKSEVSGKWNGWNLECHVSDMLAFVATVSEGTFVADGKKYDIAGSTWTVQFGLELDTGKTNTLHPATSGSGAPRVVAYTAPSSLGANVYRLVELIDDVLPAQVANMDGILGSISLAAELPDQPWLSPTSAGFASEPLTDDPRGGICALLAMTEGRSAGSNQRAVDARILDTSPAGTDEAFVVGPNLVVGKLLEPAVVALAQGSSSDDFTTDPTGTVLYNKQSMTWGAFDYTLDDGTTSTIHPTIPRGNLELALDGSEVHLSLSNVNFDYPGWSGPGSISISFDTDQFTTFDFVIRDDGGLVMVPQLGRYDSFTVNIVPSEELQIFQIAVNVAVQVLFAVLGGIVEGATGAAETAAQDSLEEGAEGGVAGGMNEIEMETFASSNASAEELEEAEEGAARDGADAVANADKSGYVQKFKSTLMANKWKILLKILEKAIGKPLEQIESIAVAAAKKDYDQLPTLDVFAVDGSSPVTWGKKSKFKITGGRLDGAMVIWSNSKA